MKISIIIPNYNHEIYLRQRIESILNQTFRDFEIIILDDKSSDNSLAIINEYKQDCRITNIVANDKNSGSTFIQWQRGFSLAKGDYIWIAESDDYIHKNFLKEIMNILSNQPNANLAFCNSYLVDENGIIEKNKTDLDDPIIDKYTIHNGIEFIKNKMLLSNRIYNASAVVFKSDILKHIDKDYVNYKFCGDWLFWTEILSKGDVIWLHKKYNYFRQHENKVTKKAETSGLKYIEGLKVISHIINNYHPSKSFKWYVLGQYYCDIIRCKSIDKKTKINILNRWKNQYPHYYLYILYRIIIQIHQFTIKSTK